MRNCWDIGLTHQPVGSVSLVKKHAVAGSPIPCTNSVGCCTVEGIAEGMPDTPVVANNKSGLAALIVAIKLELSLMRNGFVQTKDGPPFRCAIPPKGDSDQSDALLLSLHLFQRVSSLNCANRLISIICGLKMICLLQQG
jgi:hypothetical protein